MFIPQADNHTDFQFEQKLYNKPDSILKSKGLDKEKKKQRLFKGMIIN
jgi:hypothetical protein